MTYKIDYQLASSEDVENVLSNKIEEIRLQQNITQDQLAKEAGVSRSTISRLSQQGKGISLDSFIRILQALRLAHKFEVLVPPTQISPLEEIKLKNKPTRKRARIKKKKQKGWTWSDEQNAS